MRISPALLFFALLGGVCPPAVAQSDTLRAAPLPGSLFDALAARDTAILDIELVVDLRDLTRHRRVDEYRTAHLKWGPHTEDMIPLSVKPRGKLRRRICDFPPLKLKVSKDDAERQMLNDYRKMKLVTHCMHQNNSRELVLREYLAYQLYRELTDAAFDTRLVKVTYRDSRKPKRRWVRYGMLIEPNEQLAARLGGTIDPLFRCAPAEADRAQENLMAAFQLLIGNHDYTVQGSHNVKWLRREGAPLLPVPYDFDYSGFVNAHYALPLPDYPKLQAVTDRTYLGRAATAEAHRAALDVLLEKRPALLARIAGFTLLDERERARLTRYVERFYAEVDVEFCQKGRVLR